MLDDVDTDTHIDHHCKHCQKLQYQAGYADGRADAWKSRNARRFLIVMVGLYLFFLLVLIESARDEHGTVLRMARSSE